MKRWMMICLILGFNAATSYAWERSGDRDGRHDYDREHVETRSPGQEKQAEKLAERYGVRERLVWRLRDKGMGWGEVRHALDLSRSSGKSPYEIYRMRRDGMGWGQIRHRLDSRPGDRHWGRHHQERVERRHAEHRTNHRGGRDRCEVRPERSHSHRWDRAERPERTERGPRPEKLARYERPERREGGRRGGRAD